MLDPTQSRKRQQRLLPLLQQRKLDAIVCGASRHVYYFTAHWTSWLQQSAFILFADGRSWLASANSMDANSAADENTSYEATLMGTQRLDQAAAAAARACRALTQHKARRIGIDASPVTSQVAATLGTICQPIDEDLFQLRRRKDPDELATMRSAIHCCEAMYQRARQIIEPGIPEVDVFTQLNAAAIHAAGEPLSAILGNDYACGVSGGPARADHRAAAGELYILDLGPAVRGYFSDNARTISVDRHPTDAQMKAHEAIVACHDIVRKLAKPGVRCREIFSAVDDFLKQKRGSGLPHHLGHGVGLQPHEYPHLNPNWDDVLMEGEIFTAEPGQYAPELAGGIRIENQYLLTPDGVENLTPFPMEMV